MTLTLTLNRLNFQYDILTRTGPGVFEHPPFRFFEDMQKMAARSAVNFWYTCLYLFSAHVVQISDPRPLTVRSQGHVK